MRNNRENERTEKAAHLEMQQSAEAMPKSPGLCGLTANGQWRIVESLLDVDSLDEKPRRVEHLLDVTTLKQHPLSATVRSDPSITRSAASTNHISSQFG